jgi:hypothetical protein
MLPLIQLAMRAERDAEEYRRAHQPARQNRPAQIKAEVFHKEHKPKEIKSAKLTSLLQNLH